jgi:hypothetical protein
MTGDKHPEYALASLDAKQALGLWQCREISEPDDVHFPLIKKRAPEGAFE